MKRLSHLILFLLFVHSNLIAQCPTGDVWLGGQSGVDQFIIDYPNCSKISANVTIVGGSTNFNGLSNIDTILGNLSFYDEPVITSLTGLENLKYVGGYLEFDEVTLLTDFQGLNGLEYIGGKLNINDIFSLISTDGFDNLKEIGGDLVIFENRNLQSIIGFDQLISISGDLIVDDNESLQELSTFPMLSSTGTIRIDNNYALSKIGLMENLISINGDLRITQTIIPDLKAFSAVKSIDGVLRMRENFELKSLEGLNNISPYSITNLMVFESDSLSFCSVKSVCDYLELNIGPATIQLNNEGCNSEMQITELCGSISSSQEVNENRFEIYPNPAFDKIIIKNDIETISGISLVSSQGIVLKDYAKNIREIGISGFPTGIYYLNIMTNNGAFHSTFLKL